MISYYTYTVYIYTTSTLYHTMYSTVSYYCTVQYVRFTCLYLLYIRYWYLDAAALLLHIFYSVYTTYCLTYGTTTVLLPNPTVLEPVQI
jgi:hypothetical protein